MKALTISEPWCSRIIQGEKPVENRKWLTSYRGWLALHSGKGTQYLTKKELAEKYPHAGCILGVCKIIDCCSLEALRQMSTDHFVGDYRVGILLAHEYTEGPICFVLGSIKKLTKPIPARGQMGLWDVSPRLLKVIQADFLAQKAARTAQNRPLAAQG